MFLIEYMSGKFINGEEINWIKTTGENVEFSIKGDDGDSFKVASEFRGQFLNHLSAINRNKCINLEN